MAQPNAALIQDITTRFVLTAPAEQLMFFESIMFLVEQAHWYYEDYVREQDSSLRSLSLKEFAVAVFDNCPELAQHVPNIESIMDHFKAFKKNVPVMGAILLDAPLQRVLLVKGWKNSACWGFPRGKIHKNETDAQCAAREVLEETGYDIEELLDEGDFIELTLDGKRNKLFIVGGLDPDSAQFAPKCKGEIGGYAWHRIADLPATRDEGNQTFLSQDGARHKFFMVWPYLKPLRKWIRKQQRDNPEWDMPAAATPGATPEPQGKARSRTGGGGGGNAAGRSAAAQPHNKQLQYQHGSEQRRSAGGGIGGGGGGGNDSPKHHAHMSFHEAAIAQAKQSGVVSGGVRPGAVPLAPMAPAVTGGSSGPGSHTGPLRGPPAELFSGAMAGTAAAAAAPGSGARPAGGADGAAAGGPAGGSSSSSSHKAFRFNRQAILTALVEPTPVVHTRGRMAAR